MGGDLFARAVAYQGRRLASKSAHRLGAPTFNRRTLLEPAHGSPTPAFKRTSRL